MVILLQGISKSTENRSKAAKTEIIFKQWEFNGNTTEGWTASSNTTGKTENGWLVVSWFLPKKTQLTNSKVNTKLPIGVKTLKTQFAVTIEKSTNFQTKQGSSNTAPPSVTPLPQKYMVEIKYKVAEQKGWQKTLQIEVIGDGQFRDYALTFPEVLTESTVTALQFNFPAFYPGTQVKIDSIRLVSMRTSTSLPGQKPGTRPLPTQSEVTKEGMVERDNLEGVSPIKLVVSASEEYRLAYNLEQAEFSRNRAFPGENTPSGSWDDYVGKRVRVTGTLTQQSSDSGRIGIPTPSLPTVTVRTIVIIGDSSGNPTPTATPTSFTRPPFWRFRFNQ